MCILQEGNLKDIVPPTYPIKVYLVIGASYRQQRLLLRDLQRTRWNLQLNSVTQFARLILPNFDIGCFLTTHHQAVLFRQVEYHYLVTYPLQIQD
jgi:hypothetical protein